MKTKPNPGLRSWPLRTAHKMFGVEENEMAGEVRFQNISELGVALASRAFPLQKAVE